VNEGFTNQRKLRRNVVPFDIKVEKIMTPLIFMGFTYIM